jgi:YihY family inner membrane protein
VIGGVFLLWTALSLFSVLESAFNIVYGRPNRPFLYGKVLAIALMLGSLTTLFVALLVGSFGYDVLRRYAPNVIENPGVAYGLSLGLSTLGIFAFLVSIYYVLTNAPVSLREVLPGALLATVLLQVSFQVLPLYVRFTSVNVTLKTFGGPAILLVWLYVMANVIVFGAELNWWRSRSRPEPVDQAPGLA